MQHLRPRADEADARATVALVTDSPVLFALSNVLGPSNRFYACAEHVDRMAAALARRQKGVATKPVALAR